MKTKNLTLVASLALGSLITLSPLAWAAEAPAAAPDTQASQTATRRRALTVEQQVDQVAKKLDLSAKQKEDITKLYKGRDEKLKAARAEATGADRRTKVQEIQKDFNTKVEKLLKPEQLEKWKELQKQNQNQGQRQRRPRAQQAQ